MEVKGSNINVRSEASTDSAVVTKVNAPEKVEVLGMRKLAYPIDKKEEGYYVVVEFKGNPTLPYELNRKLKISDNVIRHIIINKDEK